MFFLHLNMKVEKCFQGLVGHGDCIFASAI